MHVASLRMMKPDQLRKCPPDTAKLIGSVEGEMIYIKTPKVKIVQRHALDNYLAPRIVITSFGWWVPERGGALG
jgi:hypothetical protein